MPPTARGPHTRATETKNGSTRPFIVIHGSQKAVVPDAATLWDPLSTKAEADDYAVAKAREWIDKPF